MKRYLKKFVVASALLTAVTINEKEAFAEGREVDSFKVWKVTFTDKVDVESLDNNIYVTNESGEKIYLNAGVGEKDSEIYIFPPEDGYEQGEDYKLYLKKGIRAQNGESTSRDRSLEFKVKEGQHEETYDPVTVNMVQYDYSGEIIGVSSGYMVDDVIITKMEFSKETSKIEIAFSNGEKEVVRDIVNWDTKNNLFTLRYNNKQFKYIQRKNSAHMKWLAEKLNIDEIATIYFNLIEKENFTIADVKSKLFDDGSLSGVQKKVGEEFHTKTIRNENMSVQKIYLSRMRGEKRIRVYIAFDSDTSTKVLRAYDENKSDRESLKEWVASIGNYVKENFPDYLVESKVYLSVDSMGVMNYLSYDDVYFDIGTGVYHMKKPLLTHINVDSKDYFVSK